MCTLREPASLTNKRTHAPCLRRPDNRNMHATPTFRFGSSPKWTKNETKEKFKTPSASPAPSLPLLAVVTEKCGRFDRSTSLTREKGQ